MGNLRRTAEVDPKLGKSLYVTKPASRIYLYPLKSYTIFKTGDRDFCPTREEIDFALGGA